MMAVKRAFNALMPEMKHEMKPVDVAAMIVCDEAYFGTVLTYR